MGGPAYYNAGNEVKPNITKVLYKPANKELVQGTDYRIVGYSNNTEPGAQATVTIEGMGNYSSRVSKNFTILGKPISQAKITLNPNKFEYDGEGHFPTVTLTDGDYTLKEGTDYTITSDKTPKVEPGNGYTIVFVGKGRYSQGTGTAFSIQKKTITEDMITLATTQYIYDGTKKEPDVTIKNKNLTLEKGVDFDVEYSENINVGTATVTITGKGSHYTGTATKNFTIIKNDEPVEPVEDKLLVEIQEKYEPVKINSIGYISNVPVGTSVESFKNSIRTNGTISLYYTKENSTPTTYLKTGMKLKVEKNGESVEYIIVVKGDVTGDGKRDGSDLLKIARYLADLDLNLNGAYEIAADVKDDSNSDGHIEINAKDLLKLARMLVSLE